MRIQPFHDPASGTITYLVSEGTDAVIIDPVLGFDLRHLSFDASPVQPVLDAAQGLTLRLVLETHAHADHISAAKRIDAPIAVGAAIHEVQDTFSAMLDESFPRDAWDHLLQDGQTLTAGALEITTLTCPGHTPACCAFQIQDAVFTGDALFMPDFGTGRCDFPGGSATDLYQSIQRLHALPGETRVFVGHDYGPGRAPAWETTIEASRTQNKHLDVNTTEADFVAFRTARDATLPPPRLLWPAIQANLRGGEIPPYFKLPTGM